MDKQQAKSIIRDTFEKSFDPGRFTYFTKNLLNNIEDASLSYHGNLIPDTYKPYVSKYNRIGKYHDGENRIDILIVYLNRETSLERARTMQRNFVAGYLEGKYGSSNQKEAALVAFVSPTETDWRFSLVRMDYSFDEKGKVQQDLTPARRWSFLVGSNEASHTAQSRLVKILSDDEHNPTLAQLEEAFNIEKVTREFFTKYRELFMWAKETLDKLVAKDQRIMADFEAKGIDSVNFAKKLLGQIVFLYFLQKKGWFGVDRDEQWGTGSKGFLRELFEGRHGSYNNFYDNILESLFYEALRIDRRHDDDYYSRFDCKIPFLNGGLFDPINNYDWVHTEILLPNDLFSNRKSNTDEGTGILDVFDLYNFTVKEDEPLEKDVAIDPELLGKAYEKFNAIRPDNYEEYKAALKSGHRGSENKFNKKFGVYYTPREIVHYMCQQSLINYLFTEVNKGPVAFEEAGKKQAKLVGNEGKKGQLDITIEHRSNQPIPKKDIETLIKYGDQIGENEAAVIARDKETERYTFKLPESIRENAELIDQALANITVCDPAVGSGAFPVGMMHEIVKTRNVLTYFINPPESPLTKGGTKGGLRSIYNFKRECIEQSLYGVDIDPGAVEIAKLRLWLSLVVDEEDIHNIKPLPNLDYKIVKGNSLLGVEKDLSNYKLFGKLEDLKPQYFKETSPTKKQEYKNQIDELISQITNGLKEFDFEVYFSEVFHSKGGFDVAIGNPPYINAIEFANKYGYDLRTRLNKYYRTARGTYDIYILFIEKGLLLTNRYGCLAFITPNKYLSANYGIALREFVLSKYSLSNLVDLSPIKVFQEVSVYPIISIISGALTGSDSVRVLLPPDRGIEIFKEAQFNSISIQRSMLSLLPENLWGFLLSNQAELLAKLLKESNQLREFGEVNATSTAGEAAEYGKFIVEHQKANSMKLVNTGTIDKWASIWGIVEMTNAGKKFLTPYLPLKKVSKRRQEMYKAPKIVFAKMSKSCEALLDLNGEYASLNTNCFYKPNKGVSLKTIAAICNSQVFMFLYEQLFGALRMSGGYFQFQAPQLRVMPIKYPNDNAEEAIDRLVDCIFTTRHADPKANINELEREIDQMVYQLYGLTEEEIRIVEGE